MPTLVLLRHGQSQWNLENRFTGWWDVDLSDKGIGEARAAGSLLRDKGFDFDCCFTSVLTRAIRTLHLVLHELDAAIRVPHRTSPRSRPRLLPPPLPLLLPHLEAPPPTGRSGPRQPRRRCCNTKLPSLRCCCSYHPRAPSSICIPT